MKSQLVAAGPPMTYMLVFEAGERLPDGLLDWASENEVMSASFQAIGAFESCTIAFFDRERRSYDDLELSEQLEVISLSGNVSRYQGDLRFHGHVALSKHDGSMVGGHLQAATVWPTLELVLSVFVETLDRTDDPGSGLPLLDL